MIKLHLLLIAFLFKLLSYTLLHIIFIYQNFTYRNFSVIIFFQFSFEIILKDYYFTLFIAKINIYNTFPFFKFHNIISLNFEEN